MRHELHPNARVSVTLDDDGIAHVQLTRPEKLNALDPKMFEALLEAGQALFDWPGLRCVVLSGEGKAFCAGLDLAGLEDLTDLDDSPLPDRTHGNANAYQQVAMQWRKLPVPVVAAIHGACLGGGLQIAAGADIRVATPDARLAAMEVRWGIVPDMGLFALLRGCVRDDILRELVYTHREVSGTEAAEIGLVTHLDADPVARANAIAHAIAAKSPNAVRAAKSLFNRYLDLATDEILLAESREQQRLLGARNQIEAVRSQLEGREGEFTDP
jgi:enoyl-CoA hydratase/carnithine racemase